MFGHIHWKLYVIWKPRGFGDTDEPGACKYMVKRILLCDWEGNITWARDNEFNYTREQIKEKNQIKKKDAMIKKWFSQL